MESFILSIVGGIVRMYAPHFLAKYNLSAPMVAAIQDAVPEVMKFAPGILAKASAADMAVLEKLVFHHMTQAEVNAQMDRASGPTAGG